MTVYLVGAGPGGADLLTLRAARLLSEADVVVHDRLVGPEVLDLVAPWAELIDVGKDPAGRATPQDEINRLLIAKAHHHRCVVRLKGGDPFVFGRGGEEALALEAAGIDVQVVPGISSALAGPAFAGIPVTHRGVSSGFTVLTAHQRDGASDPIDWEAAARLGTTLVVLMGASRARAIGERLMAAGMSPSTPVAVVTNATTASQSVTSLILDDLGREPVANPSVIIVGPVAGRPVMAPQDPSLYELVPTRSGGAASWR